MLLSPSKAVGLLYRLGQREHINQLISIIVKVTSECFSPCLTFSCGEEYVSSPHSLPSLVDLLHCPTSDSFDGTRQCDSSPACCLALLKPGLGVRFSKAVFLPLGWLWPDEYQSVGGEGPWWVFGAHLVLQGEVIGTLLPSHGYL